MGRASCAAFATTVLVALAAFAACGEELSVQDDPPDADAGIDVTESSSPVDDAADAAIVDAKPDAIVYLESFESIIPCRGFEKGGGLNKFVTDAAQSGNSACKICPTSPEAGDGYMYATFLVSQGAGAYALRTAIRAPTDDVAAKRWSLSLQAAPNDGGVNYVDKSVQGDVLPTYGPATAQISTTKPVERIRIYFIIHLGEPGCYVIDDIELIHEPLP